jgi:hypothetical protein
VQQLEVGGISMMAGHTGSGMLGVEHGISHELLDVVIVEAVVNSGAFAASADKASHPELRQVLGDARGWFVDVVCQVAYRHLLAYQCPEDLNAGGIRQHAEDLDH